MSYRSTLTPTRGAKRGQTTSHEGGVVYQVDPFTQFRRFLILGTASGSYYASAQELTKQNLAIVDKVLRLDPVRAVGMIVEISHQGLATSNEPALVALAKAASYGINDPKVRDGERVRELALSSLSQVARTGTHLLHFVDYVSSLRGWGTVLRRHISDWYIGKSHKNLAYQVTKYQTRDGWSHKDILRLVHPKAPDATYDGIFNYVVNDGDMSKLSIGSVQEYLAAVNVTLNQESSKDRVIALIEEFGLPREVINTRWLNDKDVQAALLPTMGVHALLRNLGNFSKSGLLEAGSEAELVALDKLLITPGMRLHPIDVLKAYQTYQSGHGLRGSGSWIPSDSLIARLDDLFYESFKTIEPTGKMIYLAVDCSGSMDSPIGGSMPLSARMAAALLAMVTARTEDNYILRGFGDKMLDIGISPHDRIETVEKKMRQVDWNWTLCDLPMKDAMSRQEEVDAFVIYTDSETGGENVSDVFVRYQRTMNKPEAKFIVNAMVANDFSIADPNNPDMLDVVGFSSDAPAVMSAFIRGEI